MLLYDNEGEDEWRNIKAENTPEAILKNICGNENVKTGVIATGDIFVSKDETKERIKKEN